MRLQVRTPIQPTESGDIVEAACLGLFPGTIERSAREVVVRADQIEPLRQRIWELRIIDAVRGALLRGADGATLRFMLSKQAAAAGKVSIPASAHPLGDLAVTVHVEPTDPWADAEALAWWICPETEDGKIVGAQSA